MAKLKTKDLVKTLLSEGKVIERNYMQQYLIIEAFGQRFKLTNPGGKGVKITQLERSENG